MVAANLAILTIGEKTMFEKKYSSERPFSIMLAEELLRAELKKLYGDDESRIFRCDIRATAPAQVRDNDNNITDYEKEWLNDATRERFVTISAIFGPFEKTFDPSYEGDNRRNLRKVEAKIRLFSTETGCIWWRPHYLKWYMYNRYGQEIEGRCFWYESGIADRLNKSKREENPCKDMCDSQTPANYPQFHNMTPIQRWK